MVEEEIKPASRPGTNEGHRPKTMTLDQVPQEDGVRMVTGLGELDRVLGGGVVPGSVVLLAGEPGIGKSTLLLQAASGLAKAGRRMLYVSGEESPAQLRLRAQRLGLELSSLEVASETLLENILALAEDHPWDLLAVDSVQSIGSSTVGSGPGSLMQIRGIRRPPHSTGQNHESAGLVGGPRDQGRGHCRPQGPGTHGGHCPLF